MNQEKIGKFIAQIRKEKNMTQVQLAEKLGVTDRSISKWETGKCMPDLSLFKPLCEELGITINELLSGEKLDKESYQEKFEENIVSTIDHTAKKINEKNSLAGIIILILGILLTLAAIYVFPSESSWSSLYSVVGVMISVMGFAKLTKKFGYFKRIALILIFFASFTALLLSLDYVNVTNNHQPPRFLSETETRDNLIVYKTPFYNVFRINADSANEYYLLDKEKKYTMETVPTSAFNREKSGVDNIIKYQSHYVGDNSNTANLINNLPFSEYGFTIQIDDENLGITVNYNATDWYENNNLYVQRGLIYNSVCIFLLIDNVENITYNFSGSSYNISRDKLEAAYPNYGEIKKDDQLDKLKFNEYVEEKLNDYDFTESAFNKIFQ